MNTEKFIDEKIKSGFLSERYNEDGTTSVIGEHSYWCEIIDELFKQSQETRPHEKIVIGAWNEWSEELPKKGEHIKVIDSDGEEYKWLFRCSCPNPKCKEIRSLSGAMIISPKLWQYQ